MLVEGCSCMLFTVVVVLCWFVTGASAQTASSTASASKPPITLTQLNDWNFGILFASPTAGSVSITTGGTLSAIGGVTPVSSVTSMPTAANFRVTGAAGSTYSLVFPSSITLTRTGGIEKITIDGFKSSGSGILVNGSETFSVAATMHLGALQPSGSYTGTNYITVVYN